MVFEYLKNYFSTILKYFGIKEIKTIDYEDFKYFYVTNETNPIKYPKIISLSTSALRSFIMAKSSVLDPINLKFKENPDKANFSSCLKSCLNILSKFDNEVYSLVPRKFKQIKEIPKNEFDDETKLLLFLRVKAEKLKEEITWIKNYYEQRYLSLISGENKNEEKTLITAIIETRKLFNGLILVLIKYFSINKNSKTKKEYQNSQQDLKNYVFLPRNKEHPDLLIAKEVIHKGLNWYEAHNQLKKEGSFMLNPKLFAEFLKLLKSGNALDGNKNKVDSRELQTILNEITKVRNPWRYEWLDNKYVKQGGILGIGSKLAVNYHKFDSSGKLVEVTEPLDADTLMQNKTPGISLDDWLNNPNFQGLPKANVQDGSLYYWQPIEGKVAGFGAVADWAGLGCDGDPDSSNGVLGVRAAKILKN